MDLLGRNTVAGNAGAAVARLALTGAALAAAPAVLTAGLLAEPTRAAVRLARTAAEAGTRAVGTLVTGADPIPDGHVRSIGAVARGMLEPPPARHTRRVAAHHDQGHGHVQVELAVPDAGDRSELRRALRGQREGGPGAGGGGR